jgi:hypothetical protein
MRTAPGCQLDGSIDGRPCTVHTHKDQAVCMGACRQPAPLVAVVPAASNFVLSGEGGKASSFLVPAYLRNARGYLELGSMGVWVAAGAWRVRQPLPGLDRGVVKVGEPSGTARFLSMSHPVLPLPKLWPPPKRGRRRSSNIPNVAL